MEDSHGKDISLQCTTVKVPGMKPRGSRVVGSEGSAISSDLDAMHLATAVSDSTANTTPGKPATLSVPKDKVSLLIDHKRRSNIFS